MMNKLRYSEFADNIDVDAFEAAIGFEVLETRNDNDTGYCLLPWGMHKHGDTTGKLAIHREKRVYNCWVCGGGSLLSLAMEVKDLDVDEATEWIRQFAEADTRSDSDFTEYFFGLIGDVEERIATMPYFNEHVLERFGTNSDYFAGRGISCEIQDDACLRYGEEIMKPAPRKRGKKVDDDYFGPAAIFPHFWDGKLVGWQHRWINWSSDHSSTPKWLSKYTNTTDFPKRTTLYGYDTACKSKKPVIVVESVPTVLFLRSWGYNSVATFGDNSQAQLRLLRRFQSGVILTQDNDGEGKAGEKFLNAATQYLERYIPVRHLPPVPGKQGADLNDFADESYPGAMLEAFLEEATTPKVL